MHQETRRKGERERGKEEREGKRREGKRREREGKRRERERTWNIVSVADVAYVLQRFHRYIAIHTYYGSRRKS